MLHPFFHAVQFPWHRADAIELHGALVHAVADSRDILLSYQQSGPNLKPLAPGNSQQMWTEALSNLMLASCLEKFCERLLQDGRYSALHKYVQAVIDATAEPVVKESIFGAEPQAELASIGTIGGSRPSDEELLWAIHEIDKLFSQVKHDGFIKDLSTIVASIETRRVGSYPTRRTLGEKLVRGCHLDKLVPLLVTLPDRFPGESMLLSDVMRYLLPCNYHSEKVAALKKQWSADQLCFFTVPTMTVAESVAAGFNDKPVEIVFSGLQVFGKAALPLDNDPPVVGPDAAFKDAISTLKDLILGWTLQELERGGTRLSSDVASKIAVLAKKLGAQLETRRLVNGERTSYGLLKMPADQDDAHLRRLVLGHIFTEVNRHRKEPVLVFGEIETPDGQEGQVHLDMESHVRFLLNLPGMRRSFENT